MASPRVISATSDGITFVPDSATGYRVTNRDGEDIGRVVRVAHDGRATWTWYGTSGGFGTGCQSRRAATANLVELSTRP